jgi:plastocyanin
MRVRLVTIAICAACVAGAVVAPTLAARPDRRIHAGHAAKHARCVRRGRHGRRTRHCHVKRHGAGKRSPVVSPAAALVPAVPGGLPGETPAAAAAPPAAAGSTPVPSAEPTPESHETAPEEAPPEPPSVPHVQVSAVEYSFSLSRTTVPAGKVDLEFVNDGQDEHNLNLDPPEEASPVEAFANTPSKGIGELQLEMRPGSYTLFCSLPGHEAKGMKATLVVE